MERCLKSEMKIILYEGPPILRRHHCRRFAFLVSIHHVTSFLSLERQKQLLTVDLQKHLSRIKVI